MKERIEKNRNLIFKIALLPFTLLLFVCLSLAQTFAPGAPGKDAQWASAGKQGVGTSASLESKVWFTLQGGALTEVYYPNVAVGNVHLLQFVVVNPKTRKVETERDDATHEIKVLRPDSLTFQQINTARSQEWKITKTYATDVERDSVLIDIRFESKKKDLNLYVYYDPSISNSGMGDEAYSPSPSIVSIGSARSGNRAPRKKDSLSSTQNFGLGANDEELTSALMFSSPISEMTNGFYKVSDGLDQLRKFGRIKEPYWRTKKGNVVQMARIDEPRRFTAILSFANEKIVKLKAFANARKSREKGFANALAEYEKGWIDYVKTLRKVDPKYQAQFNMAAMILKAHEDKTHPGANIASLSVPWGGGDNANEDNVGGYHLVWSRDLYQVFTAYMALGDKAAAERALNFLLKVQQKPDGSFPQNSWLDGKPFWGSLQMDEVAYPLIMAYQLKRFDKETYTKHLKPAADFIIKNGPATPQERWEEEGGYSPSTIAAEIAGLVCAAEIAKQNGDEGSATIYLAAADDWARKVEMWTATTTGKYGDGNYYLRITHNGKPDAGEKIELNNGAGFFDEREIVDAGFLELVRLGIKSPGDPLIAKSVKVIDEVIKVNTPNGEAFYRYNYDGYGEMDDGRRWNWDGKYTGKGRLWVLLSGERGQYELAVANSKFKIQTSKSNLESSTLDLGLPRRRLDSMQKFANNGLMIPEQIWDKKEVPEADSQFSPNLSFGEGTGSATPLAWSMAQFIRLAVNLQEGKNLDTPDVVYERYVKNGIPSKITDFGGMDEVVSLPLNPGELFKYTRQIAPGSRVAYTFRGETKIADVNEKGEFAAQIKVPEKEEIAIVGYKTPDGSTSFERVILRAASEIKSKEYPFDLRRRIANSKASPYISGGNAYFYYTGKANSVMLAGDFSNWAPRIQLQEIEDDFFVHEMNLKKSARVEYKLVVDGKWMTDPLNANVLNNGVGSENSVLEMPEYKPTTWDKEIDSSLFKKEVSELEIDSKIYGKRTVKIYIPSEYYKRGIAPKLPVLYMFDGSEYMKRAKAIEVLENLITAKKVEPFMLVFTDPKDRTEEYFASDDFADYIAEEVVPAVENKYFSAIKTGRENRAVLGASLGGITSVWVGLKHADKFANIGGQSSSFWVGNDRVVKELEKLKGDEKFNFYFDDGTFEGVEDTRRVNVLLRGKGFPVMYIEGETGHNWTSWRDRLADAFIALMPPSRD